MDVTPEHIKHALELIQHLSKPQIGEGLFDAALRLCQEKKREESIRFCDQLYQLGLKLSDTYVQGVAHFCFGSVYFALGEPDGDWDHAADHYKQSVGLFHTFFNAGCERNEAIAELALGRVYEKQCLVSGRNKWNDASAAFERSRGLFCDVNDPLDAIAEASLHRVTQNFEQWLSRHTVSEPQQKNAVKLDNADRPVQQVAQGDRNANYAVKVIPIETQPDRPTQPRSSLRVLIGLFLVLLAIIEVLLALFLLKDFQARITVVIMFFLTVLTYAVLLILWRFCIRVGAGKIGIITRGTQSRLVFPEQTFLRMPFVETLYEVVPTLPMQYDCRLEFREQESAAAPEIYQEIRVQYSVALGRPTDPEQPLCQAVLHQVALTDGNKSHCPMTTYWKKQIGDGLQRYFEDLDPDEIPRRIKDPQTKALEGQIWETLRDLANRQGWGINITDVHLRHYQLAR